MEILNIIISHLQNKSGTTQTTYNSMTRIRSGSFTHEIGKTYFGQFTIANFTHTFVDRRKGSSGSSHDAEDPVAYTQTAEQISLEQIKN